MKNILSSWQTTTVGVLIILFFIYRVVIHKESIDLQQMVTLLFGVGFLVAKDSGDSHTKR